MYTTRRPRSPRPRRGPGCGKAALAGPVHHVNGNRLGWSAWLEGWSRAPRSSITRHMRHTDPKSAHPNRCGETGTAPPPPPPSDLKPASMGRASWLGVINQKRPGSIVPARLAEPRPAAHARPSPSQKSLEEQRRAGGTPSATLLVCVVCVSGREHGQSSECKSGSRRFPASHTAPGSAPRQVSMLMGSAALYRQSPVREVGARSKHL